MSHVRRIAIAIPFILGGYIGGKYENNFETLLASSVVMAVGFLFVWIFYERD